MGNQQKHSEEVRESRSATPKFQGSAALRDRPTSTHGTTVFLSYAHADD